MRAMRATVHGKRRDTWIEVRLYEAVDETVARVGTLSMPPNSYVARWRAIFAAGGVEIDESGATVALYGDG